MPADDHPVPEPRADACGPGVAASRPDASPAWCYGCGYSLAGLPAAGVCPECGLDVAASRPAWDLRKCHPLYVRHVRAELGWIGRTALLIGAAAACAAAVAATEVASPSADDLRDAGTVALVLSIVLVLAAAGPLGAFERRWRRHPGAGRRYASGPRRTSRVGLMIIAAGVGLGVLPGVTAGIVAPGPGVLLAGLGALAATIGCAAFYVAGAAYARLVLARAGAPVPPRWREVAWSILPAIGLIPAVRALSSADAIWWAIGTSGLGVVASMGLLAWRCHRARGVLGGLLPDGH
ncbi:MAG: hypothetical protein RIE32_12350 [Phycisphaerales bacterium]